MPDTLAQKVRAKYPGVYDDLSDAELDAKVRAKYPGVYDDVPASADTNVNVGAQATFTVNGRPVDEAPIASGTANVADLPSRAIANAVTLNRDFVKTAAPVVADLGIGAAKGAGRTAYNLGKIMHYTAPPLGMLGDALAPGAFAGEATDTFPALQADNPTQDLGLAAEQLAEFFLPAGAVTKAGKAVETAMVNAPRYLRMLARMGVEAVPAAAVTAVQGGGAVGAGMAGALAATSPVAGGLLGGIERRLSRGAQRGFEQAINPTTRRAKADTARIAADALRSGVKGSLEDVAQTARGKADTLNTLLDDVWQRGGSGTTQTSTLAAKLDALKAQFRDSQGLPLTPDDAKAIGYLDELIDSLRAKGPIVSWDDVRKINQSLAQDVARAGGYSEKTGGVFGVNLEDQSKLAVKRDVSGVYRNEMAANVPGAAAINKPLSLQLKIEELANMTKGRKTGQKNFLAKWMPRLTGAAIGAGSGAASGDSGFQAMLMGMAGATLAGNAIKIIDSPRWHLFSARNKQRLADAMASGSRDALAAAIGRLAAEEAGSSGRGVSAVAGVVR